VRSGLCAEHGPAFECKCSALQLVRVRRTEYLFGFKEIRCLIT